MPASSRRTIGRLAVVPAVDVKLPVLIDPRLFGLFTDVGPAAVNIAVLKSNTPSGGWMDQPQLQAEIRRSIAVEAGNVMAVFRRFMDANAIQVGVVRKFLWLVFPAVMPIVIETQPELERELPLAKKLIPVPKRVAANLPDEERVFSYIQKAGPAGIAAYEISQDHGWRPEARAGRRGRHHVGAGRVDLLGYGPHVRPWPEGASDLRRRVRRAASRVRWSGSCRSWASFLDGDRIGLFKAVDPRDLRRMETRIVNNIPDGAIRPR